MWFGYTGLQFCIYNGNWLQPLDQQDFFGVEVHDPRRIKYERDESDIHTRLQSEMF